MPSHIENENELSCLIQQGDKQAFTIIYEKYHKMLYTLACHYLKDVDKAEDVVQQAFVKLWESRSDISISINLKNYLYTMTKNFILNQIRNENNALVHNYRILQDDGEFDDDLLENIEKEELMNIFYEAINSLPEQKRIICQYKMEEKLSNQEIAKIMDISINTVKSHYAQAVKLLRLHIEKTLIIICLLAFL